MSRRLKEYLADPFLRMLYDEVRAAGKIQSISLDLNHVCNIRCAGCYYFSDKMDVGHHTADEATFDAFIEQEKARGTNFVTIVGGEPSLKPDRLRKIARNFKASVSTNGLKKIPMEGLEENLSIGVSVWGNAETDRRLRGNGKVDIFPKALENYKDDPRAFWYYTAIPGYAAQIEEVVERCVENGNHVLFNFYGDLEQYGDRLDHRRGFEKVREAIERVIERFPDKIFMTSYVSRVVSTGRLYDQEWGYEVCTSFSTDNPVNYARMENGYPYSPHFRAYNADLQSTRRCCTGIDRDCSSCFDVWQHFSWIILNMKKHLGSKGEFTRWLTTMYMFYLINRLVDFERGSRHIAEIHRRLKEADIEAGVLQTEMAG